MNRLQAEQRRLFLLPDSINDLTSPDGLVRALVLELAQPAEWDTLTALWQGVQGDLGLPAPAIAVSGVDGYQLWFSLLEPVPLADAHAFLEGLRQRYLADVPARRVRIWPLAPEAGASPVRARLVPAEQEVSGRWSAFVAPELLTMFADDAWLDFTPNAEAQADLLSRVQCIKPGDFQRVLTELAPTPAPALTPALAPATASSPASAAHNSRAPEQDPRRFLLAVMNDESVELRWRIEAAKALLG